VATRCQLLGDIVNNDCVVNTRTEIQSRVVFDFDAVVFESAALLMMLFTKSTCDQHKTVTEGLPLTGKNNRVGTAVPTVLVVRVVLASSNG
jgi:hypothetical protein